MGNNFAYGNYMYPQFTFPNYSGMWLNPMINTTGTTSSFEDDLKSPIYSVRKKAQERKRAENAEKYAELQSQINAFELQQKEDAKILGLAKNAKTVEAETDPNTGKKTELLMVAESKEDFKKIGFWKKLGRFTTNALSGALNCGLKMLGVDEFSLVPPKLKINWKQLGITAASIAAIGLSTCIPVVGPFVLPALTALGVGIGGSKLAYGGYKAITTDNPEEFDNAAKCAGEGAVIGGLSAIGIRKMGGLSTMYTHAKMGAAANMASIKASSLTKTYSEAFTSSFINPVKAKFAPKIAKFQTDGWKSLLPKKPDWKWYQWILKPLKFVFWDVPCKPLTVYNKLAGTGYATGYNIQRVVAPKYEQSILGGLLAGAGVTWMGGDKALTKKQMVKDENGNITEQEVQITIDDLELIKTEQQECLKQIDALKTKQQALYA